MIETHFKEIFNEEFSWVIKIDSGFWIELA